MPIKALLVTSALLSQSDDTQSPPISSELVHLSPEEAAVAKEARAGVEAFIDAWNTGRNAELRKALHYPFITLRGTGDVEIAQTPDEFQIDFDRMRNKQQWDHSTFDAIEPVWIAPAKAHFKVQWSRHNTNGTRYVTGQILYVLTKVDGQWKIQVRSPLSFERLD